jgi:hypothetical protein
LIIEVPGADVAENRTEIAAMACLPDVSQRTWFVVWASISGETSVMPLGVT